MLDDLFDEIPFNLPTEDVPTGGSRRGGGSYFTIPQYGFDQWYKLFTPRQLLSIGTFIKLTRITKSRLRNFDYPETWLEAITVYLVLAVSRLSDRSSTICHWSLTHEIIQNTFSRYALPISWDFSEGNIIASSSGSYDGHISWIAEVIEHTLLVGKNAPNPSVIRGSALSRSYDEVDLILTDPPYYDAIMYADTMDFFYVWLRRGLYGLSKEIDEVFHLELSPKWDEEAEDGELVDDASRFNNDHDQSKQVYEEGMYQAFRVCHQVLSQDGRIIIVFANKTPDAWETLVSAIIRAGFVVTGSWPIQTERGARLRANASAALSSSIWLVCRKRPRAARPGWDNQVIKDMEENIIDQLREFWDAGIRGPDFVWAATGPAMEAYSRHPVVKKANEPGQFLTVPEFLNHVRRIVVDFVVGRVLSRNGGAAAMSGLDNITNYYLLHRYDYGLDDAPINAAILYAMSCSLSDADLLNQYNILQSGSGSDVKLVPWARRTGKHMGYQLSGGRPAPLIDKAHRLLHLWKAGDVNAVNDYIDTQGLRRDTLFGQLLQALIELATAGSDERALLESISNHLATTGGLVQPELFGKQSS